MVLKVIGIPCPKGANQARSFFDSMNNWARKEMSAPGLGYIIFEEIDGSLKQKDQFAKFIPEDSLRKYLKILIYLLVMLFSFHVQCLKLHMNLASAARDKIAIEARFN
jgi:aspartyl-tRNA synthetase